MTHKCCTQCKKVRALTEFGLNRASSDGRQAACLTCRNTLQKERRAYRRNAKLCTDCSQPATSGLSRCHACLSKSRTPSRRAQCHRSRSNAVAKGRCRTCLVRTPLHGQSQCESCKSRKRSRYHSLKSAGLCVHCGQKAAAAKRTTCRNCSGKRAESISGRRTLLQSVGKCTDCGQPWIGDTSRCDGCVMAHALKMLARRQRLKATGICVRCGEVNADLGVECKKCTRRRRELSRRDGRVSRGTLRPSYIRGLLASGAGVRASDIPDDLVAAKRAELRLKRLIAVKSQ